MLSHLLPNPGSVQTLPNPGSVQALPNPGSVQTLLNPGHVQPARCPSAPSQTLCLFVRGKEVKQLFTGHVGTVGGPARAD